MSATVKELLYRSIVWLRLDNFFAFAGKKIIFLKKFIPPHTFYRENTFRSINRDGVNFNVDIADYMQWYLFVDGSDMATKAAIQNLKTDSIILDIGANVGHFSLKVANWINSLSKSSYIEIHAFEPNPYAAKRFKENLDLNSKISEKVKLHQIALGDSEGTAEFYSDKKNSGASHFTFNEIANVNVDVLKLDNFSATTLSNKLISFIKIDVEGYEPEIFEGGWQTISKYRPILFFEFSPCLYNARGVNYKSILERLILMGYTFQFERKDRMEPFNIENIEITQIYQINILATPGSI